MAFIFTRSQALEQHIYNILFASVMIPEKSKTRFPLWQYLNQPLIDSEKPPIFNPRRFAQTYHIELLERCWKKECGAKGQY